MGKWEETIIEEYETYILVTFRDSSKAFSLSSSGVQRGWKGEAWRKACITSTWL
jgi:hypothetical protein